MMRPTFALLSALACGSPVFAAAPNQPLTIAVTQEFETLNPLLMGASVSTYISSMVDRGLVALDGDWKWYCDLCEQLPTLDGKQAKIFDDKGQKKLSVEWMLKPNMQWGDGKPVTGQDFRLAWEIGRSPNVAVGSKDIFERIEAVNVDPQQPRHITVIFKEPRYDFYQFTLNPLPSHIEGPIWEQTKNQAGAYEKQTAYATSPTTVGLYNGPYVVSEIKLGSHVVVKKNPKFFGKQATIPEIIIKLIPNTQALESSLMSGEVDVISELGMSFDQAVQFDKRLQRDAANRDRFKVLFRDGLTYEHIDLNLRQVALRDKNVRKALVYALDRVKLSQALFAGKQAPATQFFHPLDAYYSADVVKYDYDPKKAAQLLDAAGWVQGADGQRAKDGKKLELSMMTTAGDKLRELVEQFAQAEYKKVGVAVTIRNEPARVFFGETLPRAAFPAMAMYAWISAPDTPPRLMHSKEIPSKDNAWAGQNYSGWKNARVDEILDTAMREFSLPKRKALMSELMRLYTDEVPAIPLYLRSDIAVIPSRLANYRLTGHSLYSSQTCEDWVVNP